MVSQHNESPTLPEKIREARAAMAADPLFAQAFKKLSRTDYSEQSLRFAEWLITYYNYQSYRHHLQRLKRRKPLHPAIEAQHLQRFQQLVEAARSCVSAGDVMTRLFSESGVDEVINKHRLALFAVTPEHESTKFVRRAFASCGATDDELNHYAAWLKAKGWDLLSLPGSDGTFCGAVALARKNLHDMELELANVHKNGLPVVDGASGTFWVVFFAVLTGGVSILCYWQITGQTQEVGAAFCFTSSNDGISVGSVSDTPQGS